jgi:hypothetical protein
VSFDAESSAFATFDDFYEHPNEFHAKPVNGANRHSVKEGPAATSARLRCHDSFYTAPNDVMSSEATASEFISPTKQQGANLQLDGDDAGYTATVGTLVDDARSKLPGRTSYGFDELPVRSEIGDVGGTQVTVGGKQSSGGVPRTVDEDLASLPAWFHPHVGRLVAEAKLKECRFTDGRFLIRQQGPGSFAMTVAMGGRAHHRLIERGSEGVFVVDNQARNRETGILWGSTIREVVKNLTVAMAKKYKVATMEAIPRSHGDGDNVAGSAFDQLRRMSTRAAPRSRVRGMSDATTAIANAGISVGRQPVSIAEVGEEVEGSRDRSHTDWHLGVAPSATDTADVASPLYQIATSSFQPTQDLDGSRATGDDSNATNKSVPDVTYNLASGDPDVTYNLAKGDADATYNLAQSNPDVTDNLAQSDGPDVTYNLAQGNPDVTDNLAQSGTNRTDLPRVEAAFSLDSNFVDLDDIPVSKAPASVMALNAIEDEDELYV